MTNIFIDIEEKNESLLAVIKGLHPEMNMQNIMAYITIRKLSSELEAALEVFFGGYSLSAGRFLLMLLMKSHPEGVSPTELSKLVGVTQATISGLLSSLEKSELIVRQAHENDRRAFVIKLAPKGCQVLDSISPVFFSRVEEFMGVLKEDNKEILINSLTRLIKSVNTISARPV
jgi:DNA-binding MarR family transcriptional regulator